MLVFLATNGMENSASNATTEEPGMSPQYHAPAHPAQLKLRTDADSSNNVQAEKIGIKTPGAVSVH